VGESFVFSYFNFQTFHRLIRGLFPEILSTRSINRMWAMLWLHNWFCVQQLSRCRNLKMLKIEPKHVILVFLLYLSFTQNVTCHHLISAL